MYSCWLTTLHIVRFTIDFHGHSYFVDAVQTGIPELGMYAEGAPPGEGDATY